MELSISHEVVVELSFEGLTGAEIPASRMVDSHSCWQKDSSFLLAVGRRSSFSSAWAFSQGCLSGSVRLIAPNDMVLWTRCVPLALPAKKKLYRLKSNP